ncbi:hypothetical protein CMUS01_01422 [Colletotrichum musicola]|uniref:Uncharacterized protein n=1 Tax=Colletotrichum musicola TaxID=2175873 RepID=A0A8H6U8F8_9PEZI|nr:hypothetical protein CMUS01_01422 [Colletotrichum musicola]
MEKICCFGLGSGKKAVDAEESEARKKKKDDALKQPVADLIQLPPPVMLSGGNYDLDWLARGNTTGSFTSSRSLRSPESAFLPDPTGVEYVSDPDDEIDTPKRSSVSALGTVRTKLTRRLSQDDTNKRASSANSKTPSPAPVPAGNQPAVKKHDQAAYLAEVRRNSRLRIQADIRSEAASSRSSSTRGSHRPRVMETLVEDSNDRHDSLHSGPRHRLEFSVVKDDNSIAGVDPNPPLPRPPSARLPPVTLKCDPEEPNADDRRRSSCPKPETDSKVAASQIIARERGSLPLLPPPSPVLAARQLAEDDDDASFRTWRLSQGIAPGDSQTTFILHVDEASAQVSTGTVNGGSSNVTEAKKEPEVHSAHSAPDAPDAPGAPGAPGAPETTRDVAKPEESFPTDTVADKTQASESSQSQDNTALGTWLLAQELHAQEGIPPSQGGPAESHAATLNNHHNEVHEPRSIADVLAEPLDSVEPNGSGTFDQLTIKAVVSSKPGDKADGLLDPAAVGVAGQKQREKPENDSILPVAEKNEVQHLPTVPVAQEGNAQPEVVHYPSSSVYSSMQITRQHSAVGSDAEETDERMLALFQGLELSPYADPLHLLGVQQEHPDSSSHAIAGQSETKEAVQASATPQENVDTSTLGVLNRTQSRKSSFLQALLDRTASGHKGHAKTLSQPPTASSEAVEASKRSGHVKKSSNLSLQSFMHPISATEDFVPPKLTETTTGVWQRAFKREHDQRDKVTTSQPSEQAKNSAASENALPGAEVPATMGGDAEVKNDEVSAAAGAADGVKPKDFAVASTSTDEQGWVTDKDSLAQKPETTQPPQSISKRLGKAVKTTLNKVAQSKSKNNESAQLEYPELEILPTKDGYEDLKALEESIEQLKSSQRAKMATNPALAIAEIENESKQSMGTMLAAQFQENEHARHELAGDAGTSTRKGKEVARKGKEVAREGIEDAPTRPATPGLLTTQQTADSTSVETEGWATPASRMSHNPDAEATDRID